MVGREQQFQGGERERRTWLLYVGWSAGQCCRPRPHEPREQTGATAVIETFGEKSADHLRSRWRCRHERVVHGRRTCPLLQHVDQIRCQPACTPTGQRTTAASIPLPEPFRDRGWSDRRQVCGHRCRGQPYSCFRLSSEGRADLVRHFGTEALRVRPRRLGQRRARRPSRLASAAAARYSAVPSSACRTHVRRNSGGGLVAALASGLVTSQPTSSPRVSSAI